MMTGTKKKCLYLIIFSTAVSIGLIWPNSKPDTRHIFFRSLNGNLLNEGTLRGSFPDHTSGGHNHFQPAGEDTGKPDWPWRYLDDPAVAHRKEWVGMANLTSVNCSHAFSNKSKNSDFPQKVPRWFPYEVNQMGDNCSAIRDRFGFQRYPPPIQEEADFPLAYSIVFHKDLDQVVYLLRAIYRPHNAYCLHLDSKSSVELMEAVKSLSSCLPNVHLASHLYHINYEGFNRLLADVTCMGDLLKGPVQWKYLMNLPGQEFPLRTNLEMVRILTIYNGSNDIEGIANPKRMLAYRYKQRYQYVRDEKGQLTHVKTKEENPPAPHNFEIVKGSAYGTFSRAMVNYIVHDHQAQALLEWHRFVLSPDEYFWATLHHSGRAPGGYNGNPDKKKWLSAYALWGGEVPGCATMFVRGICIYSTQDLHYLKDRPEFFANKFYMTHHPAALHCLDQWLYSKTVAGYTLDLDFYRKLQFVNSSSRTLVKNNTNTLQAKR